MKQALSPAAVFAALIFVNSCTNKAGEQSVPVSGVSVSPDSVRLYVGGQKALTVTIIPENASNRNISFSSSREAVAIVSQDGIVEAVSAGNAIVTVTTEDRNFRAYCTVAVAESTVPVTGISLDRTSLSLTEGEEFTLTATVTPTNATDKSVTWTTDNDTTVTVSSEGVVKALKAGTATVTATSADRTKKATCSIDVSPGKAVAVTGEATHVSCRNAVLSGKVDFSGTTLSGLLYGALYSTSAAVSFGTATQTKAGTSDADHNFTIDTEVLEPDTTYYYRSYVIQNGDVCYGETKSFRTAAVSSMIKTGEVTDIHPTDATLNASLNLADCRYDALEYGFDVTPDGGAVHTVTANNLSQDKFSATDASLQRETAYSAAAYVILDGRKYCGKPVTFSTTKPEVPSGAVDLGLSVFWRKCNIGASRPEEYGTYFAWGKVSGQTWNGSSWSGGGFSSYPEYQLDENNCLKPEYDAAHVNLGDNWRMPTKAECQELIDNCTSTWTSDYEGTGVAGRIYTGKKEGYTDKSIFLPAAGGGGLGFLYNEGSYGYYWSSNFDHDNYAFYLDFKSANTSTYYTYRAFGLPVRAVTE